MAYFTLLASVAEPQVDVLRREPSMALQPSLVLGVSHLLSYWVQIQPLGQLLAEAIDGGEILHARLWQPLRPPMLLRPSKVRSLAAQLSDEWAATALNQADDDGGWLVAEIGRLLRLYKHAAQENECVVSALDSPGDEERARRVRIPWTPRRDATVGRSGNA